MSTGFTEVVASCALCLSSCCIAADFEQLGRRRSGAPATRAQVAQAGSMGVCLSKCLVDGDMTRELEEELDDANNRSYARQMDSGGGALAGGVPGSGGAPFATTSLLAVRASLSLSTAPSRAATH